MNDTVSITEAAQMMNVHENTVLKLVKAGLPAARIGRGYVLLRVDVLKHIENEVVKQTAARIGSPAPIRRRRK